MASFTKVSFENETSDGQSRSENSHLDHLISHSEVGSSSNHTPMPTQLGQLGQSQKQYDASNVTVTPSRRVHIHTIIDLDPIVVPNYQPPEAAELGCSCLHLCDHHHHYHHSSSVSHEVFRTPEVARTQLLNATLNTTRRFPSSGHQYLNHHLVPFSTTSTNIPSTSTRTNVPSTSRSTERAEASKRFVPPAGHRFSYDDLQFSEPILTKRLRAYHEAASQSEHPIEDPTPACMQPNLFANPNIINRRAEWSSHPQPQPQPRPQPQPVGIDGGLCDGRIRSVRFNNGTYVCPKCSRVFASSQLFAAHAKAVHYKEESPAERARRQAARARRRTNSNNLRLVVLDDNTITLLPHDHEHFRGENSSQAVAATTSRRGGGTERNIIQSRAAGETSESRAGPSSRSYVHESIRAKKKRAREMNGPAAVGGENVGENAGDRNGHGQAQVEDSGSGGPDHVVIVVEDD